MEKTYKCDERVMQMRLQTLRGEFESLRMTNSKNVSTYCNRIQEIINNIKVNRETLEEQQVVEKLMRSLPAKFNYVVAAIEEGSNISKMSIDRLMNSLCLHEQMMNQKVNNSSQKQACRGKSR